MKFCKDGSNGCLANSRNRLEKISFCLEVRITLDTIGNLFLETINLSIQICNMFSYGVFNGGVTRTKAVKLLGPHSDQGIDSPHQ